jgi:hypothetical protein
MLCVDIQSSGPKCMKSCHKNVSTPDMERVFVGGGGGVDGVAGIGFYVTHQYSKNAVVSYCKKSKLCFRFRATGVLSPPPLSAKTGSNHQGK